MNAIRGILTVLAELGMWIWLAITFVVMYLLSNRADWIVWMAGWTFLSLPLMVLLVFVVRRYLRTNGLVARSR